MPNLVRRFPRSKAGFVAAFLILLAIAFVQCFSVTRGLKWFLDADFYRDMANVQNTLNGNFGKDPNILGEYQWYNPLLFSIETLIVKWTGLPINIVLSRAGPYLNLLGPITFFIMICTLFELRIALAAILSYLFLASGDLPGFSAATYSPWLYPVSFSQSIFYLSVIFCYKALSTQKYYWFLILGGTIGLNFLGHTAPSVLMILMLIILQGKYIIKAVRLGDKQSLLKLILQSMAAFFTFVIVAFPLLFIIVGKYNLKFLNRFPFEYAGTMFIASNFMEMIKENMSFSFVVALIGFVWFYNYYKEGLARRIILNWTYSAFFLYIYSTVVSFLDRRYNIRLPGTVPSFHYFFYIKATQSIFFAFGFYFLLTFLIRRINRAIRNLPLISKEGQPSNWVFISLVLIITLIYKPFYTSRLDFVYYRNQNLQQDSSKDAIEVYYYILQNIPNEKVIISEEGRTSLFPVMPTARKMVSIGICYSNPYVDFGKREMARNDMLSFLETGQPLKARKLFSDYQVSFALLTRERALHFAERWPMPARIIFKNNSYTILELESDNSTTDTKTGSIIFSPVQKKTRRNFPAGP